MRLRTWMRVLFFAACVIAGLSIAWAVHRYIVARNRTHSSVQASECAGNLKILGTYLGMYANDHDGRYPDSDDLAGWKQLDQWLKSRRLPRSTQPIFPCGRLDNEFIFYGKTYHLQGGLLIYAGPEVSLAWDYMSNHPPYINVLFNTGRVITYEGETWRQQIKEDSSLLKSVEGK